MQHTIYNRNELFKHPVVMQINLMLLLLLFLLSFSVTNIVSFSQGEGGRKGRQRKAEGYSQSRKKIVSFEKIIARQMKQ